ncbi:Lar family restriction alleviation protein [Burkholderia cenocepacia]|uniref:Lar family restriction alleviation protein n=1 Tax=Burkholderia cenocepacia TaxID=95486 RepID=UPI002938ECEC|nr:Lar family restriction alleviation protein [Burkholderia cenocepacia]MDV3101761.1 Lar family restriction alleviation protein [Burkholderia cenocepacia]
MTITTDQSRADAPMDLLPCPFCGGDPKRMTLNDKANFGGEVITCTKCDCSTHVEFGEKSGLVDAWNSRLGPHKLQPAPITADSALAAIETFEIVEDSNWSRKPNSEDLFVLQEFIAHLFGGYTVAVPATAQINEPSATDLITVYGDSLTLSGAQLLEALDLIAPDRDRDQLETELTFQRGDGHSGNGMYCWLTECPGEGALFIDGSTAIPAEAAPAPAAEPLTAHATEHHQRGEYTTTRGRTYSFNGWPAGGRPTELFDAGKWAECLHASMFAASRRRDPADIEDDGPLHELTHLICGVPMCTHNTLDRLRDEVLELEQSVENGVRYKKEK